MHNTKIDLHPKLEHTNMLFPILHSHIYMKKKMNENKRNQLTIRALTTFRILKIHLIIPTSKAS